MFCKKCISKNNNKEKMDCTCDNSDRNKNYFIALGVVILILVQLYLMIFLQENNYVFSSFFGLAIFFADLLGGILGSMTVAFIFAVILYVIAYRRNIKNNIKSLILIWNGWGVLFTLSMILWQFLHIYFTKKFGSGTPLRNIIAIIPMIVIPLTFWLSGWILGLLIFPISMLGGVYVAKIFIK